MPKKTVTKSKKTVAKKTSPTKTTTKRSKPAAKSQKAVPASKPMQQNIDYSPMVKAIKKKQSKHEIYTSISEHLSLDKKVVKAVMASVKDHIACHMMKGGSGEFTLPDIGIKTRKVKKAASKAHKGRNPFTGEEIMIKAKPASTSVRATGLKALKDLAS